MSSSNLPPENNLENPVEPNETAANLGRRAFLGRAAGLTASVAGMSLLAKAKGDDVGPLSPRERAETARDIRAYTAEKNYRAGAPNHPNNGDEERYPAKWGNYSKGLQHDAYGQVVPASYRSMLRALRTGRPSDFEAITLGGKRLLVDPQAALGYDLEGPDSHALTMPPAPKLASAEIAGEIVENYWMAMARDVPFARFDTDPIIAAASADLSHLSDFRGPKVGNQVTSACAFRGAFDGDLNGPLISQFLWQDMPYGPLQFPQFVTCALPNKDYMTTFDNWLAVQNGQYTGSTTPFPQKRYVSSMRDMGQWVHVDALYEAYLNACLILLGNNYPFDPGNPYVNSATQTGFGTFGGPHILSLVTEVATRALKAVWYQKWSVHRRIRPEAYAGLVHLKKTGAISDLPLHDDVMNSAVLSKVYDHNKANNQQFYNTSDGSYLLPMAFSEGSPTHPAYGSGHATVAGACVTILKAWFDETTAIIKPVVASADGATLTPYVGPTLTVGGELNKVASNVGVGRDMAGVHWRTDYYWAALLGEALAIGLLKEQKFTYNEPSFLTLTKFDGSTVQI